MAGVEAAVLDLWRIGWPAGLMFGNEMVCWGYPMVYLVSHFGKEHATAGWIAHQYMSLSFMPAVGISVACTAVWGSTWGWGGRIWRRSGRGWAAGGDGVHGDVRGGVCDLPASLIGLFIDASTPPAEAARLVELGSMFLVAAAAFRRLTRWR